MLEKSLLRQTSESLVIKSNLAAQTHMKPKAVSGKKPMLFTLMLTSLIDAFSILVIFLLSNGNNTGQQIDLRGKIQLPQAVQSEDVGVGTVVKIVNGRYFVDDKAVSLQGLAEALIKVEKKQNLIIQADKKVEFTEMSPIILAASHAGFEKFKFVVLQSGQSQTGRLAVK